VIEQAKGILMERNRIGDKKAFELLRKHSQEKGHKLADIAAALVESHQLLPRLNPEDAISTTSASGEPANGPGA
jgi:hypothetical protein